MVKHSFYGLIMHRWNGSFKLKMQKYKLKDGFNNWKNMKLKLNIELVNLIEMLTLYIYIYIYPYDPELKHCSNVEEQLIAQWENIRRTIVLVDHIWSTVVLAKEQIQKGWNITAKYKRYFSLVKKYNGYWATWESFVIHDDVFRRKWETSESCETHTRCCKWVSKILQ